MEDHRNLSQPLLSSTTTSTAAAMNDELFLVKSGIISRLLSIIFIGIISVWANYEASKGFGITIINDARDSPAGKRFNLLYVSNDKATGVVMKASSFVENFLYPHIGHSKKKRVNHVTLRLVNNRTSNLVTLNDDRFVINVSPSIIDEGKDGADRATFTSLVLRAMARVWLWDGGESGAPRWLLDGMVEYICGLAGFRTASNTSGGDTGEQRGLDHFCSGNKDPKAVGELLGYCEKHNKGFIRRLNQALEVQWHNRTVDDALGMPVQKLCDSTGKNSSCHDCSS